MPLNLRLAYQKTGRARFISHLDIMRVFQQAFYRAELPLRYTMGFNPHAYISVALPLSVGVESLCERLDAGVTETPNLHALPALLNGVLPEGIRITCARMGGRPFAQLRYADYEIYTDSKVAPERAGTRLRMETVVDKRGKRGTVPTDIAPLIRSLTCKPDKEGLRLAVTVSAQNPSLNPEYIAEAWRLYLDPDAVFTFCRTGLRGDDGEAFDAD